MYFLLFVNKVKNTIKSDIFLNPFAKILDCSVHYIKDKLTLSPSPPPPPWTSVYGFPYLLGFKKSVDTLKIKTYSLHRKVLSMTKCQKKRKNV